MTRVPRNMVAAGTTWWQRGQHGGSGGQHGGSGGQHGDSGGQHGGSGGQHGGSGGQLSKERRRDREARENSGENVNHRFLVFLDLDIYTVFISTNTSRFVPRVFYIIIFFLFFEFILTRHCSHVATNV